MLKWQCYHFSPFLLGSLAMCAYSSCSLTQASLAQASTTHVEINYIHKSIFIHTSYTCLCIAWCFRCVPVASQGTATDLSRVARNRFVFASGVPCLCCMICLYIHVLQLPSSFHIICTLQLSNSSMLVHTFTPAAQQLPYFMHTSASHTDSRNKSKLHHETTSLA